eukprot:g27810.t1
MQSFRINAHLDHCLGVREGDGGDGEPGSKRARLSPGAACGDGTSLAQSGRGTAASASVDDGDRSCSASPSPARGRGTLPWQSPSTAAPLSPSLQRPTAASSGVQGKTVSLRQLEAKPLAEIMRPSILAELIGQNKVLGENTLLRTLLESHEIPSIILWGPPGCGKVTPRPLTLQGKQSQPILMKVPGRKRQPLCSYDAAGPAVFIQPCT